MSKRVVLIIVDSFGIGEMNDVIKERVEDIGSNTVKSVTSVKGIRIDSFKKLGLFNICECNNISKSEFYKVASSELYHYGADSYFGHQEMFGSKPEKAVAAPFNDYIDKVEEVMKEHNLSTSRLKSEQGDILIIEDCFTLADNVETDPGQAYNITADLNKISFDKLLEIAKVIRKFIKVPRLIVFGSKDTNMDKIKSSIKSSAKNYVGIDAPKSGVYTDTYQCVHLGHGVNVEEQIVQQLYKKNIYPTFLGKVGDIVYNPKGINITEVDTKNLMELTIKNYKDTNIQFIATNIQETDLAGHSEDVQKYANKISIVDEYLEKLISILDDETLLIVTADHGNDPLIGHKRHTRENVPILFYPNDNKKVIFDKRKTLADIGSTVVKYLINEDTKNGKPIL